MNAYRRLFLMGAAVVVVGWGVPNAATGATTEPSVTQFGITWTFSEPRSVGQYANGDWWVLAPVEIVHVSPESVDQDGWVNNGTMVNPRIGGAQGYDSSIAEFSQGIPYDPVLNHNPAATGEPIVLTAPASVVSVVSRESRAIGRPQLQTAAVLTVVDVEPQAGAFRPPPTGTDKRHLWFESDLDYTILRRITPVASSPDLGVVETYYERVWINQVTYDSGRYIHPLENQPNYGRDIAHRLADGLLMLHFDYPNETKRDLYVRLVQIGVDIYGAARDGQVWLDLAGINVGVKMPLVLAALALDEPNLIEYADASKHFIFAEDRQTWYVTEADVGRALYHLDGRPRVEYLSEDVGVPEWGEQHSKQPEYDGRNWDTIYRSICYSGNMGHALAARLTPGARELWNWPAFHDYMERAFLISGGDADKSVNSISPFVAELWTSALPPTRPRSLRVLNGNQP